MANTYRRNHVVSQCLLKRFQDTSGQIIRHDIIKNLDKTTRPGVEGFHLGLWTKTSAQAMETLWNQQAENDIQTVLAKVDLRKKIERKDLEILARFCAIHFVRSNEFIKLYKFLVEQKANEPISDPRLDFTNKYRVRLGLLKKMRIPSKFFENTIASYYYKCAEYLRSFGVEIGIATGKARLILPDGGLLIADVEKGKYQPSGGVALMQSKQAIIPLGPKILLGFNARVQRVEYRDLSDRNVANANEKLLQACNSFYYRRP